MLDLGVRVVRLVRLTLQAHVPQDGPDAGQQHVPAERLGDVVVGAHVQTRDDVAFFALGRQHDDGHAGRLGIRPQLAADGQTIQAGQHQVQQDQIGHFGLGHRQRFLADATAAT